jgi:tetratricopeptide (TPR) repeat protein
MYYVRESIIGFGKLLAGAINSNSARREAMIRSSLLTLSLSFDDMGFMGFASKLSEWKSEFEADGKMPREDDSIWLAINEYITYVSCGEKCMSNLLSMEELVADLPDGYRMDKVRVKEILADSYLEAGEYEKALDRYRFVISAIEDYIDEEFEHIDNDIIRYLYELYLKLADVLTSLGKTEEAEEVRQICENMSDNEPALW